MRTIRMLGTLLLAAACALSQSSGNELFQQALMKERSQGDLKGAIDIYQRIVKEFASDRRLAARALLEMARCQEKQGGEQARRTYERLLKDFSDQAEAVSEARARIAALSVPTSTTSPRVRQLWAGADVDDGDSISPDGRWLTHTHWQTGDLAIRDLLNNTSKLLTNTGGWEKSKGQFTDTSRISPDGKLIAYNWYNWFSGGSYELRVMNADGSGARALWAGPHSWIGPASWSPDGKTLAVGLTTADGVSLHMVSVASGEKRELLPASRFLRGWTSFSPDGKWLALAGIGSDGSTDLFTLPVAGGKAEPLVTHPSDDMGPYWSADGRSVLFLSNRSGTYGLWQVAVENGKAAGRPELLRGDLGNKVTPIGFTKAGSFAYSLEVGGPEIYTADFDPAVGKVTGKPVMLSDRRPGFNVLPRLSPDGSRLAWFALAGEQELRVTIRDLATSNERTLPSILRSSPNLFTAVAWAPDGSKLLLDSRVGNRRQLSWMDAASGQMALFRTIEPGRMQMSVQFSADGKTLYQSVREITAQVRTLIALDVASGQQRTLYKSTPEQGVLGGFAVSPDGRWLACVRRATGSSDWELILVPTAGGEPRVVVGRGSASGSYAGPVFSPDGKSVLLGRAPGELIRVDVSTGAIEPAGLKLAGLQSVQVHPSGRKIFFQAGQRQREIWIAENILPRQER